ncbi:hypothetical protein HHI36_018798 [Cryptolaemus montrouzieri]|uniref:Uncharacterized protein n=1 Tax=Cryptolaemus montrouzieri TaxID=559131 RepID=A0ABD2P135_9CUCU
MIHRYNRERPSLGQRSTIDYVIKRKLSKMKTKTNDCRVKRGANYGSDHRLVAAKLVVPYHTSRSGTRTVLVPEEQGALEGIKHPYQRRLDSALAGASPSKEIEEKYSNIKLALKRVAHEALGYEQKRKVQKAPTWLTDEVKQSIDEEKKCYHRRLSHMTNVNWERYKAKTRKALSKNRKPNDTKKRLENALVESVLCFGSELWTLNAN